MSTASSNLQSWVEQTAKRTRPGRVHWCDGSRTEYDNLIEEMAASGVLIRLNEKTHPNCTLHRSHPQDVARTEHLTFICTRSGNDAGPTNNWLSPEQGRAKVDPLFDSVMRGRTMYVVPYVMGPLDSPYASVGVEITDSPYVAASMRVMTRMGAPALKAIEKADSFVRGLHSTGDLSPERRFIMHFPEERTIQSIGSGYGGNALLGKKCHALRIASWEARRQGWLAEHMLIAGVETPEGEIHYIAAAFPSACGKTNLAMLIPPASHAGWRVWTVGEDIAWMHVGEDGRLWAINPEAGVFGVAPGTGPNTNRNVLQAIQHDTIFTNVALTADGQPWWEGLSKTPPAGLTDWRGRPFDPKNGPAAHPNSRFTVPIRQLPTYSSLSEAPQGVPISAILFGGRRAALAPLVVQARDWAHGVFMGASLASETTAAATGAMGQVRRDPMAMLPFCGYNMADYWAHWLAFGERSGNLPPIFHVNWFRQDGQGRYLWPGFGENLRVLRWIIGRSRGGDGAVDTPIGAQPSPEAIDLDGLDLTRDGMRELTRVDPSAWTREIEDVEAFFARFGKRLPAALADEARRIKAGLRAA
jgi:phosphoenolpyruvate carboxykinase (GTP)